MTKCYAKVTKGMHVYVKCQQCPKKVRLKVTIALSEAIKRG